MQKTGRPSLVRRFEEDETYQRVLKIVANHPRGIGFDLLCRKARLKESTVWEICDAACRVYLLDYFASSGYRIQSRGKKLLKQQAEQLEEVA